MQLWHYVAEPQCTRSRSALTTDRYAIRSGTHAVALGGESGGIVVWEPTMAGVLSAADYATACFGRWHIGAEAGRWPTDHGFDVWYGPPRSYDECLWPDGPWYDPQVVPTACMLEGRKENRSGSVEISSSPLPSNATSTRSTNDGLSDSCNGVWIRASLSSCTTITC
jgi:arylsulfatase A-like enzyme